MNKQQIIASIDSCLKLQDSFNAIVNPEWRKAGYQWRRAMWVESAELVDMMGYKWWKNVDISDWDKKQMLLEVVDIFHFLLSEVMIDRRGAEDLYNSYVWATRHTYATTKEKKIKQVEEFIMNCLDNQSIMASFFQVVVALEIDLQDLLKYYLGKNALNKFRQDNGYKQGTYVKMWSFDGETVEDNKVLEKILETSSVVGINVIYDELKTVYDTMTK